MEECEEILCEKMEEVAREYGDREEESIWRKRELEKIEEKKR